MPAVKVGPEGTKYVRFSVDIWYQADDGHIHIASNDLKDFHTTVNRNPGSKRHHANLFLKLQKVLEANGKWPQSE